MEDDKNKMDDDAIEADRIGEALYNEFVSPKVNTDANIYEQDAELPKGDIVLDDGET